ncbi:hypothetical protein Tco_0100179, partial [Tanacetum coccineum]
MVQQQRDTSKGAFCLAAKDAFGCNKYPRGCVGIQAARRGVCLAVSTKGALGLFVTAAGAFGFAPRQPAKGRLVEGLTAERAVWVKERVWFGANSRKGCLEGPKGAFGFSLEK